MDLGALCEDPGDRSYKLLCPALRESLAAKVLRENLAAQGRNDIEPECPHMRNARNAAIVDAGGPPNSLPRPNT
jgi:hypothetical protein